MVNQDLDPRQKGTLLDITNPAQYRESDHIERSADYFAFVPFAEQEGEIKIHRIRLPIPGVTGNVSVQYTNITDYTFGWGDNERLDIVIPDTPVIVNGEETSVAPEVAFPIMERGDAICSYFEFLEPEQRNVLSKLLPETDILKIEDFANAMRSDPSFVHPPTDNNDRHIDPTLISTQVIIPSPILTAE